MRRTQAALTETNHGHCDRAGHCISLSWVIDTGPGMHPGAGASDFAEGLDSSLELVGQHLDPQEDDEDLKRVLAAAIAMNPERHSGESAAVALALHTPTSTTMLVLGNCLAFAVWGDHDGAPNPVLLSDRRFEDVAIRERDLLRTACHAGADRQSIRGLGDELTRAEASMRNREGGFWVAASDPLVAARAHTSLLPPFTPTALTTIGVPGPLGSTAATLFAAETNGELVSALNEMRDDQEAGGRQVSGMAAAVATPHWWDTHTWAFPKS